MIFFSAAVILSISKGVRIGMKRIMHSLTAQIFAALFAGIVTGIFFTDKPELANDYIKPFGTIFLNLIKFIVVPIVFFSIITGVISMSDIKKVGAIGAKTLIFYFVTTAFAITLALTVANVFRGMFRVIDTTDLSFEADSSVNLMDTLINIFPSNIIGPFAESTMLQVIVASLLFGFGIIAAGSRGEAFGRLAESISEVSIEIMEMILKLSPIGVFCLIAPVIAEYGPTILSSLGLVLLCAYICYFLHTAIVYSVAVGTLGGISPVRFFREMAPAMALAFSSASSVGTLPLSMECCERLGARRSITGFVLPLGATVNMDGTAIYQGVCAIFIAACYGIQLTLGQMITVVLTSTLASVGTAGVPGAGTVMLAMVLESVNLPVSGIALVMGLDRIFDMGRTVVNITGDAACSIVVSRFEKRKTDSKN